MTNTDILREYFSEESPRDEIIKYIDICNQIIADMEVFNLQIIRKVLNDTHPKTRIEFAKAYNIRVEDIPAIKLPEYNVDQLKTFVNDVIHI